MVPALVLGEWTSLVKSRQRPTSSINPQPILLVINLSTVSRTVTYIPRPIDDDNGNPCVAGVMNPLPSSQPAHSRRPHRRTSIHRLSTSGSTDYVRTQTPPAVTPRGSGTHAIPPTVRDEIYEINEIKRYEDFTTIDWVQDAVHEQARRRAKRKDGSRFWDQEGTLGWRRKVSESYDAGQSWLVVTIVGAAIGLNAAFLNIVTEWLADIKLGYCTTGFYLNESFCCWGAEDGCPEWRRWTSIAPLDYIAYFIFAEMASYFPLKTLWRSYFCALVATGVLAAMNPFRTGQLVMFQVKYARTWHSFELVFFVLLGVFGGLYGAFVMKWNLRSQAFRKKYLSRHPIIEATVLAGVTALICYPNMFLRINMTEMMEILFRECEGAHDYNGICDTNNRWSMVISLAIATIIRILLVIISYGCKVPAGIFVPSMAIGASFGRMVGILVQALHEAFPDSKFFRACEPDVPCITPGTYAFLGAGAALSGIMHLTVSVTVIMFEITGALTYILPTMIVVGVTKAVSNSFGKGGIADRMIWFNGFPFLDSKEDHIFNVPVSHAMTNKPAVLPAADFPVSKAEKLLRQHKYKGFPIVEDAINKVVIGFIGRTELQYAINRAKQEGLLSPNAKCRFTTTPSFASYRHRGSIPSSNSVTLPVPSSNLQTFGSKPSSSSRSEGSPYNSDLSPDDQAPSRTFDDIAISTGFRSIDFSPYVDPAPITVHPRLPLETVMEIFKKMGPRVILVEHRGRLSGLVTVKDCLKYQFKVEAQEHIDGSGDDGHSHSQGHGGNGGLGEGIVEKKAWEFIQWATNKVAFWRRMGGTGMPRFLRLGSSEGDGEWHARRRGGEHERSEWDGQLLSSISSSGIVEGTEELDERND
ncbi:CLC voltage-gated chloride channel protein [Histoplasma capsulatum var. duboisii H88]|uniref:Chloride channel protein n=1 Tax=Ajellomyces capsulatus (strain H88) TaxID=544711 RepID=F0UN58_AJEC8|nr:CLC voltage-gated chloride channel protein [Histoplasma capsulatum var. duboisii H88]